MAIIYEDDASFARTTAKVVGPCWIEYPFKDVGDITTKVYNHPMKQATADYAPLANDLVLTDAGAKPDGSPFADDVNAFSVPDSNVKAEPNGFVTFTRTFANIPQDRLEPSGYYGFEFPDVPGGIFISKTSTAETISYNTGNFELTLTATLSASDAAEFDDGEYLIFVSSNYFSFAIGGGGFSRSAVGGIVSKSGNVLTIVSKERYFSGGVETAYDSVTDLGTGNYEVKRVISADRNATAQLNSPSALAIRYVKVQEIESIKLNPKFELTFLSGTVTTRTSDTTLPLTTEAYVEAGLSGDYVIGAENETIQRWRGNIYELSQIKVQAK